MPFQSSHHNNCTARHRKSCAFSSSLTADCNKCQVCTRGWNHFFLSLPTNRSNTVTKMTDKHYSCCSSSNVIVSPSEHPVRDDMGETVQHTWDSQDVPPTQELPAGRYYSPLSLHRFSFLKF